MGAVFARHHLKVAHNTSRKAHFSDQVEEQDQYCNGSVEMQLCSGKTVGSHHQRHRLDQRGNAGHGGKGVVIGLKGKHRDKPAAHGVAVYQHGNRRKDKVHDKIGAQMIFRPKETGQRQRIFIGKRQINQNQSAQACDQQTEQQP